MKSTTDGESLGRLERSPLSVNPSLVLRVLEGGATTVNLTDVLATNRAGFVWKERVSSVSGWSTLRRVNSATPLTNGTLVIPPRVAAL